MKSSDSYIKLLTSEVSQAFHINPSKRVLFGDSITLNFREFENSGHRLFFPSFLNNVEGASNNGASSKEAKL